MMIRFRCLIEQVYLIYWRGFAIFTVLQVGETSLQYTVAQKMGVRDLLR